MLFPLPISGKSKKKKTKSKQKLLKCRLKHTIFQNSITVHYLLNKKDAKLLKKAFDKPKKTL